MTPIRTSSHCGNLLHAQHVAAPPALDWAMLSDAESMLLLDAAASALA